MCIFKIRNWKELKITSALEAETFACVCGAESMGYMHQYQASWVSNVITLSVCISLWVCACMCVLGMGSYLVGVEVTQALLFCMRGWQVLLQGGCSWLSHLFFLLPFVLSASSQDTCVLSASTLSSLKQRTENLHDHTLWKEKVCAGYAQSTYS